MKSEKIPTLFGNEQVALTGALEVAWFSTKIAVNGIDNFLRSASVPAEDAKALRTKIEALSESIGASLEQLGGVLADRVKASVVETRVGPTIFQRTPPELALSPRELQVFQLIGLGYRTKDIAKDMGVSIKTVDSYRQHIKTKMKLGNGPALTVEASAWVRNNK